MAKQEQVFSRREFQEMDRRASSEWGILTSTLMDIAASHLAAFISRCAAEFKAAKIVFICGPGNNGGDGFAAARVLAESKYRVTVVQTQRPAAGSDAAIMQTRLGIQQPKVKILASKSPEGRVAIEKADILVDCIFGTGLSRPAAGSALAAIKRINAAHARGAFVIATDIPSGLDCDTGQPLGTCISADATVTFVGLKKGFIANPESTIFTGEVFVAEDIGVPRKLKREYGQKIPSKRRSK